MQKQLSWRSNKGREFVRASTSLRTIFPSLHSLVSEFGLLLPFEDTVPLMPCA